MAFGSHASTSCGLVSLSWCLLRAGCSRRRVVYDTELQRRIESLYPRGVATCFHAAFTAHRADAGGSQLQALVRPGTRLRSPPLLLPFAYSTSMR